MSSHKEPMLDSKSGLKKKIKKIEKEVDCYSIQKEHVEAVFNEFFGHTH